MNSSAAEALFQKLARYANDYKKAKCYLVQILAKGSFCELWKSEINGKEYSHSRVYRISGLRQYPFLGTKSKTSFLLCGYFAPGDFGTLQSNNSPFFRASSKL